VCFVGRTYEANIKSSSNINASEAKSTDQIAVHSVFVGKDVSASSNLLTIQEFFFNLFGFGLVGGNLRINLLFVCEIVGKSRVHSGGRQMLVLADDIFRTVAEIMQDRYSINANSGAGNAALPIPNVGCGCQQRFNLGAHISSPFSSSHGVAGGAGLTQPVWVT
jgi:hypothetical protein